MLQRFWDIKSFLPCIGDRDVDSLMPSVAQDRSIEGLLLVLQDLDTATVALQSQHTTLVDVRNLFDQAIEEYPGAACRLSTEAGIVANIEFENAVVYALRDMTSTLNDSERLSVQNMRVEVATPSEDRIEHSSLAERAEKRMKKSCGETGYIDGHFIRPTSDICERFFSQTKYVFTDRRRPMSPQSFERQMFLNANKDFWGINDVTFIMSDEQ
ncbi:hypothetical protein AeNC1_017587 [Aphanomyces euteiches]|nr:hypothetical protein AeNC1_017587 [Aphanomyces euteiches]